MPTTIRYLRLYAILILSCVHFNTVQAASVPEQLEIKLSDETQIAINNGVKLVFDCDYAKFQSFWFFSLHKHHRHHQFELQRHSLSNRYVVRRGGLETQRIFQSISEATAYISTQAVLQYEFYRSLEQSISVRISLNKYALPGPMRLGAFLSQAWDLDSGWVPN